MYYTDRLTSYFIFILSELLVEILNYFNVNNFKHYISAKYFHLTHYSSIQDTKNNICPR